MMRPEIISCLKQSVTDHFLNSARWVNAGKKVSNARVSLNLWLKCNSWGSTDLWKGNTLQFRVPVWKMVRATCEKYLIQRNMEETFSSRDSGFLSTFWHLSQDAEFMFVSECRVTSKQKSEFKLKQDQNTHTHSKLINPSIQSHWNVHLFSSVQQKLVSWF